VVTPPEPSVTLETHDPDWFPDWIEGVPPETVTFARSTFSVPPLITEVPADDESVSIVPFLLIPLNLLVVTS